MIQLDTHLLIDLATAGCPHLEPLRRWLREGEQFAASAVAWSEFCNGPHSVRQKDAVFAVLGQRVLDFSMAMAEQASRLYHLTGRRRGSHPDCMIAATAMVAGQPVATRNIADFQRFEPYGLVLFPVPTVQP